MRHEPDLAALLFYYTSLRLPSSENCCRRAVYGHRLLRMAQDTIADEGQLRDFSQYATPTLFFCSTDAFPAREVPNRAIIDIVCYLQFCAGQASNQETYF